MSEIVLDRIIACLLAAQENNANAHVAPVALLWPDEGRQWEQVVDRIGVRLPLVSLGDYDPAARRGPAYWIRCVVAGTVDVGLPAGVPVIYMPGVARHALRAVDSCPGELAPIAELQYRSQWFSHPNSRDWTVRSLLSHVERGLGLHIADDAGTSTALLMALGRMLDERVERLSKQVVDGDYCNQLINPDPPSILLRWLDDPVGYRGRLDAAQWSAFLQQCKVDYGFEPPLDGEITAARKLGARQGNWAQVWKRFAETPDRYPGIPGQLRKARPDELFVENRDSWPQDNEMAEDQLRNLLHDFAVLTPEGARQEAELLEVAHTWRRSTVWAELELAPLAFALEQLARLAKLTAQPLASTDLPSLTSDYESRAWRADDAVLRALATARNAADRTAVSVAASAIYRTWVDAGAKALQSIIGPMANVQNYQVGPQASTSKGTVTVFIDGLRLDIANRVRERLLSVGLGVECTTSLAALPTVTQTAKAALVPVIKDALAAGPELGPNNSKSGAKATIQVLRSLMGANGVQVLGSTEMGDPSGAAWTEAGEIDHRGHDAGVRLVDYLDEEVDRIVERMRALLDAGWQRVEAVTDHGWVLLPGGLEKVELPPATTEVKKGRCARLKEGAVVEVPTVPWFWDNDVRIAVAPGATCFEAGKEYEHGGVSPQECIVPRMTITIGAKPTTAGGPEIIKVKWLGLLCRIELSGVSQGVIADLRALPGDPKTSIAEVAKETASLDKVSLLVPDEEHEGERAHLVLIGPDGRILVQREVVVGRNQ